MKTFAEYLPTMTAREREIVEAFAESYGAYCAVYKANLQRFSKLQDPLSVLRATPPAKEPVSEECDLKTGMHVGTQRPPLYAWPKDKGFKPGDRVRVVKIEEMK